MRGVPFWVSWAELIDRLVQIFYCLTVAVRCVTVGAQSVVD